MVRATTEPELHDTPRPRVERGGAGAGVGRCVAAVGLAAWIAVGALGGCGRSGAPAPTGDRGPQVGSSAAAATARPGDAGYQGRPIAQTCSYLGADWLERADRAEREQPDRVLDALKLDPHSTAADVGAGTGYFTRRLARRVARVLATDVQPEMLELLTAAAAREHLTNIEAIHAGEHDAALPPGCCDLVLLVDVYHELSDPPGVMAGIRRALTERGRLVLIEYRGEDPRVAIKPEHKMTLAQIQRELTGLGFAFVESLEFLPDQRVVIFTRAAAPP
ncbi:MAG TPA: methyltransferase domain-containing protein [Kofleriaceae bacterium]|nr:methyltransferase domain-containing protein [Kofleriaceae bacterium]